MSDPSIPRKCCSSKDKCVHPDGPDLPATAEYFHRDKGGKYGFVSQCKACVHLRTMAWLNKPGNAEHSRQSARQWAKDNPEKKRQWEIDNAEHLAKVKREWRKANPEKVKQQKNASQKRNRASANVRSARHNAKYPERQQARIAVSNAIHLGKMLPASSLVCVDCGNSAQEYHHTSYEPEDWLNVTPLCEACHKRRHFPKGDAK